MNLHVIPTDALEAELKANEEKRIAIYKETVEPAEKIMTRLYNRNDKIRNEIAARKIKSATEGKLDWDFILYHDHGIGQTQCRYQQDILFKLGLGSFGFHQETKQVALSISFNSSQTIKQTEEGIQTVLPHMKWMEVDSKKVKSFHVIDRECSYHNSWHLFYFESGKWELKDCRGSFGSSYHFKNLHSALVHIKKELCDARVNADFG